MAEIKQGDLVQISDQKHPWFPCVLLVEDVHDWGVTAGVMIPNSNTENRVNIAWIRLKTGQVEKVGEALYALA